MTGRKILPFIQKPSKGNFKTQDEIRKANQKRREETLKRIEKPKP